MKVSAADGRGREGECRPNVPWLVSSDLQPWQQVPKPSPGQEEREEVQGWGEKSQTINQQVKLQKLAWELEACPEQFSGLALITVWAKLHFHFSFNLDPICCCLPRPTTRDTGVQLSSSYAFFLFSFSLSLISIRGSALSLLKNLQLREGS